MKKLHCFKEEHPEILEITLRLKLNRATITKQHNFAKSDRISVKFARGGSLFSNQLDN